MVVLQAVFGSSISKSMVTLQWLGAEAWPIVSAHCSLLAAPLQSRAVPLGSVVLKHVGLFKVLHLLGHLAPLMPGSLALLC